MEKSRSSRKTEEPKTPAVRKGEAKDSPVSAEGSGLYKTLLKKDIQSVYGSLANPADLQTIKDVLRRWTKLRDPEDSWVARYVIEVARRIVWKQLMEIAGKENIDIGDLVADLAVINVFKKTLMTVDNRVAKAFLSRLIKGKTEEETASALGISKAAVEESWRHEIGLITERLKERNLSAHISQVARVSERNILSNQEIRLPSIIERATEVIGDRQEAMRWLGTPVRGLDYATPISLLATDEGAQRVSDILGQIEHGVW